MNQKNTIHKLLKECKKEVLDYIRQRESNYPDGWVPATDINDGLGINFSAVPQNAKNPSGQKGWLFATFARMLEDDRHLEYKKKGTRSYYKTIAS